MTYNFTGLSKIADAEENGVSDSYNFEGLSKLKSSEQIASNISSFNLPSAKNQTILENPQNLPIYQESWPPDEFKNATVLDDNNMNLVMDKYTKKYYENEDAYNQLAHNVKYSNKLEKLEKYVPDEGLLSKAKSFLANRNLPSPEKARSIHLLSKQTNLPLGEVEKNYDSLMQDIGFKQYPKTSQLVELAMLAVAPGLIAEKGLASVAKPVLGFMATKEASERTVLPAAKMAEQAISKQPVKYEKTKLSEFFPEELKDDATLAEFLIYGSASHNLGKALENPRVKGELAGIRYRVLKALGVKQPTALVPLTEEQIIQSEGLAGAARRNPKIFRDAVERSRQTETPSGKHKDIIEKIRKQSEVKEDVELKDIVEQAQKKPNDFITVVEPVKPIEAEIPRVIPEVKNKPKTDYDLIREDIQSFEAGKRGYLKDEDGAITEIYGISPSYATNPEHAWMAGMSINRRADIRILDKISSGKKLTEKQQVRAEELLNARTTYYEEQLARERVEYEDALSKVSESEAADAIREADKIEPPDSSEEGLKEVDTSFTEPESKIPDQQRINALEEDIQEGEMLLKNKSLAEDKRAMIERTIKISKMKLEAVKGGGKQYDFGGQRKMSDKGLSVKSKQEEDVLSEFKPKDKSQTEMDFSGQAFVETPKKRMPSGEAAKGGPAIGEYETEPEGGVIPTKVNPKFKLTEETKNLMRAFGVNTAGEGYLTSHAVGLFHPETDNIRLESMNQISIAIHEISHHLDRGDSIVSNFMKVVGRSKDNKPIYDSSTRKFRKRLTDIYVEYYGGGKKNHKLRKRLKEGLATFIERMVSNPQSTSAKYQDLISTFLNPSSKFYDKKLVDLISKGRNIVNKYQASDPLTKIGSRITSDNKVIDKQSFLNRRENIITETVDALFPIEKMGRIAGVAKTKEDPSLYARLYNNINSIVANNLIGNKGYWSFRNGDVKKIHDFNWKTLVEDLQKRGASDEFSWWLVSRREHFAYAKLDELKVKAEEAGKELEIERNMASQGFVSADEQKRIAELKRIIEDYIKLRDVLKYDGFTRKEVTEAYQAHEVRFKEQGEMFDQLVREDLELLSDPEVQLITKNQRDEYAKNEGYATFKRQEYDEIVGEEGIPTISRTPKTKVSSMMGRTGSQKTIIDPVYASMKNHHEIMKKAMRQIVLNKVGSIASKLPSLFQKQPLKRVKEANGKTVYPQEKDPDIIMTRSNYKRVPYLVDSTIKRTIDEVLTPRNIDLWEKIVLGFARQFTKGTTGIYPQFAITNIIRDQMTAVAQTEQNYRPLYDTLKEWGKSLIDNDSEEAKFLQEYLVLGGQRQTLVGWYDLSPTEVFKVITKEVGLIKQMIGKLEEGLSFFSQQSEIATRASEYIKSRKSGESQVVALERAGRITAPFHHVGRWGGGALKTVVKGTPYFNAALEVLAEAARKSTSPEGKKRYWIVVAAIAAAYVGSQYYIMKTASEDQKKQYKDIVSEEKSNYIYWPLAGGVGLGRIAVPSQISFVGNLINMALLDLSEKDVDYTIGEYLSVPSAMLPGPLDFMNPQRALLSILIPQYGRAAVEVLMNKRTYPRTYDLVSKVMQKEEPRFQYTEYTSELAKSLGNKLNLSPIKIDHLIQGYLGRGISQFTGKPFSNPITRQYYFQSGRTIMNYYNNREIINQKYNTLKNGKANFSEKEMDNISDKYNQIKYIDKMLSEYRDLDIEKNQEAAISLRGEIYNLIYEMKFNTKQ